jgi:hypothetical protein
MDAASAPDALLVYVWIRDIHPLLWRRVLVRADSTLADLHWVFQIAFGWTDFHLHRFRIRKKDYAIPRHGLTEGHDPRRVRLTDLTFRRNERFLYEYDFGDLWQVEVRTKVLNDELRQTFAGWYPGIRTNAEEQQQKAA